MSEELPREEGLPAESEESERWISNLQRVEARTRGAANAGDGPERAAATAWTPADEEELAALRRKAAERFSALPKETPCEAISRFRVCATCRRSLDKLKFSRTQWNKKQVGVSRCWDCVSSDLEALERARERELCSGDPAAARARLARRNEDYDAEAAASPGPEEKRDGRVSCCPVCGDPGWMSPGCPGCHHPGGRPGQRTAAQRHNKEERTVPCCYVFLCGLLECLECACFFCWLTS